MLADYTAWLVLLRIKGRNERLLEADDVFSAVNGERLSVQSGFWMVGRCARLAGLCIFQKEDSAIPKGQHKAPHGANESKKRN